MLGRQRPHRQNGQSDCKTLHDAAPPAESKRTNCHHLQLRSRMGSRDRRTLLVPSVTRDKRSTHDTDQFKPLSKPSREPAASTSSRRLKPGGSGLTVPRRLTGTRPWSTSTNTTRTTNSRSEQSCQLDLWGKHLLNEAGIALDSTCDRCGNRRDDTYHRFWGMYSAEIHV